MLILTLTLEWVSSGPSSLDGISFLSICLVQPVGAHYCILVHTFYSLHKAYFIVFYEVSFQQWRGHGLAIWHPYLGTPLGIQALLPPATSMLVIMRFYICINEKRIVALNCSCPPVCRLSACSFSSTVESMWIKIEGIFRNGQFEYHLKNLTRVDTPHWFYHCSRVRFLLLF